MKIKRKSVLLIFLILFLVGCGNEENKIYSYEDLSNDQQAVVDGVWKLQEKWDIADKIAVEKVKFYYEKDILLFLAFHPYEGTNGGGVTQAFEVNESDGTLSVHAYDSLFNE